MDRDSELRLLDALRRGDERAFDEIYAEYRPRIFGFVLRMVGRPEVAEELCQEVWMRMAAKAAALDDHTRLAAWLFTVARNLCLSYWRTRHIEESGFPARDVERSSSRDVSPETRASEQEMTDRLERALARLPRNYREALLLVGLEEMTPAEAAIVCGIKPEAMRKRVERARDMLAAALDSAWVQTRRKKGDHANRDSAV